MIAPYLPGGNGVKHVWSDAAKYLVLVLVLLLFAWLLLGVPEGTFEPRTANYFSEIGSALVGAAVTAATAALVVFSALSARRRKRVMDRRYAAMRRDSVTRRSLQVADLLIPGVIVVAAMPGEMESQRVRFEFEPMDEGATRVPEHWEVLEAGRLQEMKHESAAKSVQFTDDQAVDLARAGIRESRRASADGVTTYSLVPRRTSYHVWAASSGSLDRTLTSAEAAGLPGAGTTLRQRWSCEPTRLEDVEVLPAPAKIGCGVVVVTTDGYLVTGLRGRTFVAGGHEDGASTAGVHFVAEGMIPEDTNLSGRLDPFVTARRGLMEELGLGEAGNQTAAITDLVMTGVFFDAERWQPGFCFLARTDATFDELSTLIHSARDFWEMDQLVPLPADPFAAETRDLMLGSHPQFHFASNHAHALAYFALLHEHGLDDLRDAMVAPRPTRGARRRQAA